MQARRFGLENGFDDMVAEVNEIEGMLSTEIKQRLKLRAAPGVHEAIKPFWDLLKLESAKSREDSPTGGRKQKKLWGKVRL